MGTGRSELDDILDDWRLPRNQNGEPAHIPKPGINGLQYHYRSYNVWLIPDESIMIFILKWVD